MHEPHSTWHACIQTNSRLQCDALMSSILWKQDENMDLYMLMNMHVVFNHEINSKLTKFNMHATIRLQSNMLSLKHDLALLWGMNHARTRSNSTMRRLMAYLKSCIQGLWTQFATTLQFLQDFKPKQQEQFSLSLTLF